LNGLSQHIAWLIRGVGGVITNTGAAATFTLDMPGGGHGPGYSGVITGAISLVINSSGVGDTQTLSAISSYTGSTTINGGNLYTNVSNALPTTTDVTIGSGGGLNLGGNQVTIGSLSGAGPVQLSSGKLTISGPSSTTYSGIISDANNNGGQLAKA